MHKLLREIYILRGLVCQRPPWCALLFGGGGGGGAALRWCLLCCAALRCVVLWSRVT